MPSKEFLNRRGSIWERTSFVGKPFPVLREEMDSAAIADLREYDDVSWEPGNAGEISGKWVYPKEKSEKLLYYIHGGGFTLGSSGIPMPFLMELSHRLGITCFSADYRLAPEHQFPAAPEDAFSGYKALLEMGYLPENIVVCGESAGGTLSLDIPLMCKDTEVPVPKAVIALSPLTDAAMPVNGVVLEGLDDTDEVVDMYAPGVDKKHPLISPYYGDLSGYPAVFLSEGGAEALGGNAIKFAQKASASGVDVRLRIGKDMIHTYPLDLWDYPEAMEAFEEIELFIRQQIC